MQFTAFEIQLAKKARRAGLNWTPHCGDWFYTESGYCELARHENDLVHVGRHTWLPLWEDCREWLKTRGWHQLEFLTDRADCVEIEVTHDKSGHLSARGKTDRECLYKVICRVLEEL